MPGAITLSVAMMPEQLSATADFTLPIEPLISINEILRPVGFAVGVSVSAAAAFLVHPSSKSSILEEGAFSIKELKKDADFTVELELLLMVEEALERIRPNIVVYLYGRS
ncbi:WSSV530 [White spot syndrome virus]|uniref:WSSV530 n=2 Tax=White spot syndrome virus TaxID=342409 RepID=Q77EE0_WSSV|nr:WSSV530 [Shrimp white spot syndrome virus]AFX59845.1 wsv471 [White spot syndrome virus]AWQ60589.1 wsv471 [Shrimp white spot syndrome virus]AWQ61028.1 wsv471 [Shrimp white spot syndrome virus]AWQ61891.1 wsv471 [Shrimp white spot syndrome virus]